MTQRRGNLNQDNCWSLTLYFTPHSDRMHYCQALPVWWSSFWPLCWLSCYTKQHHSRSKCASLASPRHKSTKVTSFGEFTFQICTMPSSVMALIWPTVSCSCTVASPSFSATASASSGDLCSASADDCTRHPNPCLGGQHWGGRLSQRGATRRMLSVSGDFLP